MLRSWSRDLDAAARRAELEGGVAQIVRADVPLGGAAFADDTAPRDALVAVPLPPGSDADSVEAAGMDWVIGASLAEARLAAGKVQGRRTTAEERPPLFDALAEVPSGGVRLATSWVEPAYLEPDASWCAPGGPPASPYVNGGAFGGKIESAAPRAAEELAVAARIGRARRLLARRRRASRAQAAADRGDRVRSSTDASRSTASSRAAPRPRSRTRGRRRTRAR